MSDSKPTVYKFGQFLLEIAERRLVHNGQGVPLPPKVFDTLVLLVTNSGHLMEKERLLKELWPDTFVEEVNLSVNISALRKVLHDGDPRNSYIQTIPKRGYRFTAEVIPITKRDERATQSQLEVPLEHSDQPTPLSIATRRTQVPKFRHSRLIGSAGIAAVALVVAGLIWHKSSSKSFGAPSPHIKSIAVLPFKPLREMERDETFELGMTDVFVTKLSNLKQLKVSPTSAVRKYKQLDLDPIAAGHELNVEAVLEGNLQKLSDRIRVTVRLLRVSDGSPLWAGEFDDKMDDIFAVEDSIATQVTRALRGELSVDEQKEVTRHYTDNAFAYECYLKGRYFWNKRTKEGLLKAVDYFHQATQRDPSYALAYSGEALAYVPLGRYGYISPAEAKNKARAAAQKALELDPSLAEAHNAMAVVHLWSWHWNESEKEYKRALEINPDYAAARQWYSELLVDVGRTAEAAIEIKIAQQQDPTSVVINGAAGMNEYYAHNYEEAVIRFRKAAELEPDFLTVHWFLGLTLLEQRKYAEAVQELRRAVELSGGSHRMMTDLAYAYAVSGHKREAEGMLADTINLSNRESGFAYDVAVIYLGLGDKSRALIWLEKAYDEQSSFFQKLKVDPRLEPLHQDPIFMNLLQRVGLAG